MTAACPACIGATGPAEFAASNAPDAMQFSLPTIHCTACIGKIERGLASQNGVQSVRVNLSLKRLTITGPVQSDAIISAVKSLGFEIYPLDAATLANTTDKAGRNLLIRMAVAGFAMMNVMLLSVAVWSGASDATRDFFHLISAAIALPTVAYSAQPFFQNALSALRKGGLNMDVPISLAIILAAGMSLFETLNGGEHAYFDAAVSLTFFLLIGRYLDHQTRSAARSAAKELTALESHTADRIRNGVAQTVQLSEVAVDDIIAVPAGTRVPVDGVLLSEAALMDRSFLTGESAAVHLNQGSEIQAGEVNLAGPLQIRATAVGEDTTLRRMAELVELAESGRNGYTALADRAAAIYAPAVHLLALVAFLAWWVIGGDVRHALNIAIAVLIITCPCALGLAVPAVTTAAISRLFNAGFLVKHATALERLAEVNYVLFDKTGTFTKPAVHVPENLTKTERAVALGLAQVSHHPMSRALVEQLQTQSPAPLEDITEVVGQGVQGRYLGQEVQLGRGQWLGASFSGLGMRIGDASPIQFEAPETLRTGVREALSELCLPAGVVTGEATEPAQSFAKRIGLKITANARPTDKLERISALEAEGKRVLMVGDGLNDTAALASAHASIAPALALEASRSASDVVILKDNFTALPMVLRVAKATQDLSKQNFAIAAAYNMIAIPIALAGAATPLAAALAMSISSITVLLNSQRMRSVK